MLIALDHQLRVRGVNPAARQVLGPPPAEGTLISYVRSLDLEDLVRESLELGTGAVLERIVRFGRRPFLARAVWTPQGIGVSLADIAERERLGRARQDMVANLSHELRTPLTALRLLADTLQVPAGQDPSTARELASKISAEVDTLSQMTQEMLDLAAIESGRQVIRLVPTSLADVVARALERHADQARRQGVTVRVEVPAGLEVLADGDQAVRAVENVLHNAVKFSPAGGVVEIRGGLDDGGDSVTLSIADEGPASRPRNWSESSSGSSGATGRGVPRAPDWGWRSCATSCKPTAARPGRKTASLPNVARCCTCVSSRRAHQFAPRPTSRNPPQVKSPNRALTRP